jgi:uncharacterized protein
MFGKIEKKLVETLDRAEVLIDKLEQILPLPAPVNDWKAIAYRWRRNRGSGRGFLQPVAHPHVIRFEDLKDINEQKSRIDANSSLRVDLPTMCCSLARAAPVNPLS